MKSINIQISEFFENRQEALKILKGIDSCHSEHLEDILKIVSSASKKHGLLKCALLSNELEFLNDPNYEKRAGGTSESLSSADGDWGDSINDFDADSWESHYNPRF